MLKEIKIPEMIKKESNYDYNRDKKDGDITENEILTALRKDGFLGDLNKEKDIGILKQYDISGTIFNKKLKIECKSDKQAINTGNITIEFMCYGKNSGLTTTAADFWTYTIEKNTGEQKVESGVLLFNVVKLKEKINQLITSGKINKNGIWGGDNRNNGLEKKVSRMYLIKISDIIGIAEGEKIIQNNEISKYLKDKWDHNNDLQLIKKYDLPNTKSSTEYWKIKNSSKNLDI